MPFDPHHLTPNASLNRLVLASAPAPYTGQRAYDLLSRAALIALIQSKGIEPDVEEHTLGDPDEINEYDLLCKFHRLLAEQDALAVGIAEEMGIRLYWLLHTLKHGHVQDQAARPDWDASHWAQWAQLEHIRLGGGMVVGEMGEMMAAKAQGSYTVEVAPDPLLLPIRGAAKRIEQGLIFDFGQSAAKIAFKKKADAVPYFIDIEHIDHRDDQHYLLAHMVRIMTRKDLGVKAKGAEIILASYLDENGQPVPTGTYGLLRQIADDVRSLLVNWLKRDVVWAENIHLWHDGTAAAHYYAGQPRTAVIMLGTALGVGFAPSNA